MRTKVRVSCGRRSIALARRLKTVSQASNTYAKIMIKPMHQKAWQLAHSTSCGGKSQRLLSVFLLSGVGGLPDAMDVRVERNKAETQRRGAQYQPEKKVGNAPRPLGAVCGDTA